MVAKKVLDFSNTKDAPDIRPVRLPAGDYAFKITKVNETITEENKNTMWTFILVPNEKKSASYPYRCILTEKSLWKLRNLLVACGKAVPKKRVNVDPEKLVGSEIGGTLEDSEYNDREQSEVTSVFPADELEDDDAATDPDSGDVEGDDEEVDEEELEELDIDDI